MLTDQVKIKRHQARMQRLGPTIKTRSELFSLGADPTRLKILYLLQTRDELCVSEIASILKTTISAISHQLRRLERASMVTRTKMGKNACYSLTPGRYPLVRY